MAANRNFAHFNVVDEARPALGRIWVIGLVAKDNHFAIVGLMLVAPFGASVYPKEKGVSQESRNGPLVA